MAAGTVMVLPSFPQRVIRALSRITRVCYSPILKQAEHYWAAAAPLLQAARFFSASRLASFVLAEVMTVSQGSDFVYAGNLQELKAKGRVVVAAAIAQFSSCTDVYPPSTIAKPSSRGHGINRAAYHPLHLHIR